MNRHIASIEDALHHSLPNAKSILNRRCITPIIAMANDQIGIENDYQKITVVRKDVLYQEINDGEMLYSDTTDAQKKIDYLMENYSGLLEAEKI